MVISLVHPESREPISTITVVPSFLNRLPFLFLLNKVFIEIWHEIYILTYIFFFVLHLHLRRV